MSSPTCRPSTPGPQPIEIHGRVTRDDSGVAGAAVILADPHDGRLILAKDRTDADGSYSLRTYQTGALSLYATQYGKRGVSTAGVIKKLRTVVERTSQKTSSAGMKDDQVRHSLPLGWVLAQHHRAAGEIGGVRGQMNDDVEHGALPERAMTKPGAHSRCER
jgi:hypothetical protein